jgi:putative phosphoesterase
LTRIVAVLADTHLPRGSRRLPDECVRRLRTADVVLHAGDFVGRSFLAELKAFGPPVHGVHGNMDEPALRDELPRELTVDLDGVRVGMVHNAGPRARRGERLVEGFPGCDAVVYGHTHIPEATRAGDVWILNPGSPTERRRAPVRSMLVVELAGGELRPRLIELPAA